MCLDHDENSRSFGKWLLKIGSDHATPPDSLNQNKSGSITIPNYMICCGEEQLINDIYGSIKPFHSTPAQYLYEHVILAPLNERIHLLNNLVLKFLPGLERIFNSADSQIVELGAQHEMRDIPLEFLHSLNASGIPLAHLVLKIGSPVLIL